MKVVTYNIKCDPVGLTEADWQRMPASLRRNSFAARQQLIEEKLRAEQPDIIGFQETQPHMIRWLKEHFPDYIFMGNGLGTPATEDTPGAKQDRLGGYWTDLVYDQMVEPAYAEQDLAKRYAILAEAEAWLIDEAYVIPFCMDGGGYVASYLNPFESQYAPFGVSENRYKYQWIYETPMGMDEYETALAEWEAERDARLAALAE